jgi:phosphocarrier protein HPr
MRQQEVEIINKLGLHARAAAKLTQLAAKYQCEVSLARNGRKINAKSIMGVSDAMDAILALIGDCFGEGQ